MFRRLVTRPAVALFVLLLGTYAYFYQAGGWNQNVRFDLVRSMVEQRSSTIDSYYRNTGDLSCRGPKGRCTRPNPKRGKHAYCDKAPGVSWLAVPAYAVVHGIAGGDRPSPRYLSTSVHISTVWAISVPSALAAVALFWLLALLGLSMRARIATTLAYGLATLAFPYATLLYGHQLMGALLLMAFALLVRMRRESDAQARPLRLFVAGLLLGLAVVVEYPAALAVIVMCIYAAWFVRPWSRLVWLIVGGGVAAIALAAYHWSVFGGPLTLPYEFSTQPHRGQGYFMGIGAPDREALENILFTSYRGLFYSAPWLLLAVPGAVGLWRWARWRAEVMVCAAIVFLYIWLNASLVDWHGGWTMGARYLVPIIPFLVLLATGCFLAPVDELARRLAAFRIKIGRRALTALAWLGFAALTLYSAFLMLVGTAVKPEVPVYIKRPFQKYLLERFYGGDLAVNTQSIDSAGAPKGGEPFAYNLGQVLGLDGLASLLPLALFMAAAGLWLWWTTRAGARALSRALEN